MGNNDIRFDGQVAIVTGSGRGLGRSYALMLARRGAKLVLNGRPATIDTVAALREEIRALGGEAIVVAGLVGEDETARNLVNKAIEHFGRIDIIVNNAGVLNTEGGHIETMPDWTLDDYLKVHIYGSMQLTRAAWPHMKKQKYGRILFTGSAQGTGYCEDPNGYEFSYGIAKAAMFAVCRQTAASGWGLNINANIVMPIANTPMVATNYVGTEIGKWVAKYLSADQVAESVAYLLHKDCTVSGEAMSSAGGWLSRVYFAETTGYFNPNLTAEDVRDHWELIAGKVNEEGVLVDSYETTDPLNANVASVVFAKNEIPSLAEINKLKKYKFDLIM